MVWLRARPAEREPGSRWVVERDEETDDHLREHAEAPLLPPIEEVEARGDGGSELLA